MAVTFQGKGYVYGTPATFVLYAPSDGATPISGYISPAAEGISISHNAEAERVQDSDGDYAAVIITAEYIECTFELRCEGTSVANALASTKLPPVGSTVKISGAKAYPVGSFTDAINTATDFSGNRPWVYEGGGSLRATNTGKTMLTLPLRRYPAFDVGTAIS